MKPIIGILSNLTMPDIEGSRESEKTFVNSPYINAVLKAGGVPIIIPVNTDEADIQEQIKLCSGIIVSGGIDINPLLYNEEPLNGMGTFHPDVDEFDILAIKIANNLDKPILAICRGIQIMNVAFGGSLYQDISHVKGSYINHSQSSKKYVGTHTIKVLEESILWDILGQTSIVNSYHHQCVKEVAHNFRATAYSKDGIIEAIEMIGDKFVIGVQWHPELMIDYDSKMMYLFKKFIERCKKE